MRLSSRAKLLCLGLCLVAPLALWLVLRPGSVAATPLPKALQVDPLGDANVLDAGVAESPTTATIVFATVPYVTAVVTWGKKPLGRILPGKPLVVVRPRDSGPLDVVIRAAGYLPVQTRAHTFSDSRVVVKLTPPDKKNELVGYRVPIDAGLPEGGVYEGGLPMDGAQLPVFPPAPVPPPPVPPPSPVPPPVPPAAPMF